MNVRQLHDASKLLSVKPLFKSECGTVSSLQLLEDGLLDKHITKVPAVLICIKGNVIFENEKGFKESMVAGDFVLIEPNVVHWVKGIKRSDLILFR
jgi:quercetin dioxygenase-like cupin family protein